MKRSAAICLFALAFAVGCRKTGPDASYEQANALYQQLYASQLDDAYGDPKMDEVVALLKKVDPHSSDADSAQRLLGTIQRGREALAKDRAESDKLARAAAEAAPAAPNIDPEKVLAASEADAGQADPYGNGALVSEINTQTGGCLTDYEPFNENGTGVSGTVYRVAPGGACASKLPGYAGQAVLVVNGRVYRRIADPNPPQAAQAPDAGTAARPAAPKTAAAKPAEPEYRVVIPGAPQPGAATPPQTQQ